MKRVRGHITLHYVKLFLLKMTWYIGDLANCGMIMRLCIKINSDIKQIK